MANLKRLAEQVDCEPFTTTTSTTLPMSVSESIASLSFEHPAGPEETGTEIESQPLSGPRPPSIAELYDIKLAYPAVYLSPFEVFRAWRQTPTTLIIDNDEVQIENFFHNAQYRIEVEHFPDLQWPIRRGKAFAIPFLDICPERFRYIATNTQHMGQNRAYIRFALYRIDGTYVKKEDIIFSVLRQWNDTIYPRELALTAMIHSYPFSFGTYHPRIATFARAVLEDEGWDMNENFNSEDEEQEVDRHSESENE
ncbi:hypothetical protein CPB83DRAFT_895843 [Crepidotus variabilis]|uniref:Uncharacterized protein n=1 Tax=Crepidotus variabilis TaxID=179855 RepID=A0A9P6ED29_9AGAR|nr:hypothetical protein CPB83DRAFT_895843 [Crepidotus variabilis]